MFFVEVEYSVTSGNNTATAVLRVTVLPTVHDLIGPVIFVREPTSYVNEPTHFVFMAARHLSSMKYEVDYGDGEPQTTFDGSGSISPIPGWAGLAAANAFQREIRECDARERCRGSVLRHVYKRVGNYTARVGVAAAQQLTGGLNLTVVVDAVVRRRTLAQVMSSARVYRRLPGYHDEQVVMLFRANEFAESLSLTISFDGEEERLVTVRNMSGNSVPPWFKRETSVDITVRTSTVTAFAVRAPAHRNPFFGVEIEKLFQQPGRYDVRFIVSGTLPDAEAPQRALIVARVDVTEKLLDSQLAGGPLLFAQSPISSHSTTELLVIVRRLIRGVTFTVDFGDGTTQPVSPDVFSMSDLPHWLLAGTFNSPEPFTLAGRGVTYYGRIVQHQFREPGFYAAAVKATVALGGHCEVFTSQATIIHVMDRSTPPLSQLLGDDAIVVSRLLVADKGFQAFYLATHSVSGARFTFFFGDGMGPKLGRMCSEWPHIVDANQTIAGRLTLQEARKGSAATAVCISHVYVKPGLYSIRVRVRATPSGIDPKMWNLGGQVTVLSPPPIVLTTPTLVNAYRP